MTYLLYFRLLKNLSPNFSGKFDLLMPCGDTESNLDPFQAKSTGTSTA